MSSYVTSCVCVCVWKTNAEMWEVGSKCSTLLGLLELADYFGMRKCGAISPDVCILLLLVQEFDEWQSKHILIDPAENVLSKTKWEAMGGGG